MKNEWWKVRIFTDMTRWKVEVEQTEKVGNSKAILAFL